MVTSLETFFGGRQVGHLSVTLFGRPDFGHPFAPLHHIFRPFHPTFFATDTLVAMTLWAMTFFAPRTTFLVTTWFLTLWTFGPYGEDMPGGISAHGGNRYHLCALPPAPLSDGDEGSQVPLSRATIRISTHLSRRVDTVSILFIRRVLKKVAFLPPTVYLCVATTLDPFEEAHTLEVSITM